MRLTADWASGLRMVGLKLAISLSMALGMSLASNLSAAADWQVPRTASGHPDLQGIWSNATQTPLERPTALGNQRFYTTEDALAREQRAQLAEERANSPSDPNRSPPTDGNTAAGYNAFWLDRGTNIARIDGEYRTSMIISPENGRIPWLPESERQPNQLARWLAQPGVAPFDGPELQSIGERCLLFFDFRTSNSSAGPPMMPIIYNNNYQIVQTEDYVVILAEMMHDARIIRIDDEHQPASIRKWMGDSVGHWQGDTLVVVTRNFHPQQSHYGASPDLVVTEHFTRTAEDQIDYRFTMDDPAVYSAPWTAEMPLRARPAEEKIYEYACHEGNYALMGILAGARRQEQDAQEAQERAENRVEER
ncbi:MAG: hypothetical protein RQ757_06075 [Pseudomonadales bacterium]|nr:hypothetical protein [Pseudomonadales bacterium]